MGIDRFKVFFEGRQIFSQPERERMIVLGRCGAPKFDQVGNSEEFTVLQFKVGQGVEQVEVMERDEAQVDFDSIWPGCCVCPLKGSRIGAFVSADECKGARR